MSTILVTGATGSAGRCVIPALQSLGFQVRGQYNRERGLEEHVDWRQMNFLESLDFGPLVEGCDAVVHLAAEVRDASRMDRVNVEATRALLAAAQSGGARYFEYASSIVVYGRRVIEWSMSRRPSSIHMRQWSGNTMPSPTCSNMLAPRHLQKLGFATSSQKLVFLSGCGGG